MSFADCFEILRFNGYTAVLSHRPGETEDRKIADLAVATRRVPKHGTLTSPLVAVREPARGRGYGVVVIRIRKAGEDAGARGTQSATGVAMSPPLCMVGSCV
jgi:hypothetical protein